MLTETCKWTEVVVVAGQAPCPHPAECHSVVLLQYSFFAWPLWAASSAQTVYHLEELEASRVVGLAEVALTSRQVIWEPVGLRVGPTVFDRH